MVALNTLCTILFCSTWEMDHRFIQCVCVVYAARIVETETWQERDREREEGRERREEITCRVQRHPRLLASTRGFECQVTGA